MEKYSRRCDGIDYTLQQIRHSIERYRELRSLAEIVASNLEDAGSNDFVKCRRFEHIVCIVADLDNSIVLLTPRQQQVVKLVKAGYSHETISYKLNLSVATIKFHLNLAILKISTYLNSG